MEPGMSFAEFNTIITFLGMGCASVQAVTGGYAACVRKRTSLLRTNEPLHRGHRSFGSFATALYAVGLFAGVNGLLGGLTHGHPPFELDSASFNIHTWGSFPALFFVAWKTWLSYFRKPALYKRRTWLGPAAFLAWLYTWVTAAVSYYIRTQPGNLQHPEPTWLLPYEWMAVQIVLPLVLGGWIGWTVVRRAHRLERAAAVKPTSARA